MSGWCVWTVQQEGVECGVHRAVSDYLAILAGVAVHQARAAVQSDRELLDILTHRNRSDESRQNVLSAGNAGTTSASSRRWSRSM